MNDASRPSKSEIIDYINEQYPSTRSAVEQAEVVLFCLNKGALPDEEITATTTEIKVGANATGTHIDNLVDEVGLLEKAENGGGDKYFRHERLDKTIWGYPSSEDFDKMEKDLEMFLDHCRQNPDIRDFVASKLDASSSTRAIERKLREDAVGEPFETSKFDSLVMKIQQHDKLSQVHRSYDRLGWRTAPNRYQLTWKIREVGKKPA